MNNVTTVKIAESAKKRLKIYYSLLITVICIIGVSFAWFRLYLSQKENNEITSLNCLSVTFTENSEKIVLTDAYPIKDAEGLKLEPYSFKIKNNCAKDVRAYITIDSEYRTNYTNTYLKDSFIKANVSRSGSTNGPSVVIADQELLELENDRMGYEITDALLKANEEKSYDLRLWMDSSVTASQGLGKSWQGKMVVVVQVESGNEPDGWNTAQNNTLLASIRNNYKISSTLTTPGYEVSGYKLKDIKTQIIYVGSYFGKRYWTYGSDYEANGNNFNLLNPKVQSEQYSTAYAELIGNYILSDDEYGGSTEQTVSANVTNVSCLYYVVDAKENSIYYKPLCINHEENEGVFAATEDDYGTSYYFRGTINNNYLEFANMCWRIVRVTGDGTVKIVLFNENHNNSGYPCSDKEEETGWEALVNRESFTYNGGDNAHLGLMYGDFVAECSVGNYTNYEDCVTNGGTWGSSSYEKAHQNIKKNEVLDDIEDWYKNVLSVQKTFDEGYLADTIWCNDKSIVTDISYNPYNLEKYGPNFGYGNNSTYYGAFKRLVSNNNQAGGDGPSLVCPNDYIGGKLSKYTVSDKVAGNGDLDYKIGMLTADEFAFAGAAYGKTNPAYYLFENANASGNYTLSPMDYSDWGYNIWTLNTNGHFYGSNACRAYKRPAIALRASVKVTGNGTLYEPFVVQ